MNDLLLTALNACIGKLAKAASPIAPGSYGIDETITLHLTGNIRKANDELYTPTISIPWLAVMALFTEKVKGVVQENQKAKVEEMVIECMTLALTADVKADPIIKALLDDMKAAEAKVRSMTAALPDAVRTGKTFVDCTLVAVPAATVGVTIP